MSSIRLSYYNTCMYVYHVYHVNLLGQAKKKWKKSVNNNTRNVNQKYGRFRDLDDITFAEIWDQILNQRSQRFLRKFFPLFVPIIFNFYRNPRYHFYFLNSSWQMFFGCYNSLNNKYDSKILTLDGQLAMQCSQENCHCETYKKLR